MRVSFDLDGVLYPWHKVVWKNHFADEDYLPFWRKKWEDVPRDIWRDIVANPENYKEPARADVVNMIHNIAATRFVFYITQRSPADLGKITQTWLVKNGFPFPGELYFTPTKVEWCKKLGIDLHVEDRLDVMHDLADNDIRVLGVRHPWNEHGIDDFPHVDNVLDLEREIARIDTTMKVHRRRNGNG